MCKLLKRWFSLLVIPGLGLGLYVVSLLWLQSVSLAAPPIRPVMPPGYEETKNLTITATKTSLPADVITAGQSLTYTIIFTTDIVGDAIIITDATPAPFVVRPETITGDRSVMTATAANLITWTFTTVPTNTAVILTFVVTSPAAAGHQVVTNTAWLSGTVDTGAVTCSVTISPAAVISLSTYLPAVLKNYRCSPDAYEPNNGGVVLDKTNTFTWTSSNPDTTIMGNFCIDYPDPNDYFWLDLADGRQLEIWLYPPSTADYDVYIYKGNTLQQPYGNNTGFGVPEHILYTTSDPGIYFVRVYPFNKGQGGDSYTLRVKYQP